jgi:1-acyl-sn-glycerol-3-phosphate acyltransferase
MKVNLVPAYLRRRSFPVAPPPWPGGVERPPLERTTGVDFETEWARQWGVRLGRAAMLDGFTRPLVRAVAQPVIDGLDRLAGLDGPVIFAANHASHVDTPLMLTSLPERFRHRTAVAAGADYFFDKRWKGALWAFAINAIPIERTKVSLKSTRLAESLLREGWSLVIFPEGGRSPDGWGQSHRAGAAFLAVRSALPVVPVHLEGTRRILAKGRSGLRLSNTHVTFGTPIRPQPGEDARQLSARIEAAIEVLADEQATDWWTAQQRAAKGKTPSLTGPGSGAWRRSWALGEGRRRTSPGAPAWPKL